ncbi:transposase, partial [Flavobacterium branchiophilum]|uniref:transposase n=1 Tax=Flavobacterium branchiophilum TaxID=55197 RepID=UPI001CBBD971
MLEETLKNAPETFTSYNLYVQDESRYGLFTRNGRALTAKGVKPICTYQNIFKSTYVFGAFSPYNGDSLVMELPYCNGDNFQIFLNELSNKNPTEFKVVVLDNGRFHKGK